MADPAELIEAEPASHVIAALRPFYYRLAHGTEGDILSPDGLFYDIVDVLSARAP